MPEEKLEETPARSWRLAYAATLVYAAAVIWLLDWLTRYFSQ